jgi:hypothetical protein
MTTEAKYDPLPTPEPQAPQPTQTTTEQHKLIPHPKKSELKEMKLDWQMEMGKIKISTKQIYLYLKNKN